MTIRGFRTAMADGRIYKSFRDTAVCGTLIEDGGPCVPGVPGTTKQKKDAIPPGATGPSGLGGVPGKEGDPGYQGKGVGSPDSETSGNDGSGTGHPPFFGPIGVRCGPRR